MSLEKLNLSDQDVVRYENLEKIKELGIDPFPAEQFLVNFSTVDYTTEKYKKAFIKGLEALKNIGSAKAEELAEAVFNNKFRVQQMLQDEELVAKFQLSETASFDDDRPEMPLGDFLTALKVGALGEFQPEKMPEVSIAGRFMGQRGPFAQLQDSKGRIQLYLHKKEYAL